MTTMTMTTATLRDACPGDAAALVPLFHQLGYPGDAGALRERLTECGSGTRTLVAETAQGVRGVVVIHLLTPMHVASGWALVSALVVDETARGSGIGALLLDAAEGHAWAHGCSQVELSSSEHRTRAHAFYEQQGYAERRKRFVKPRPASAG